MKRFIAVWPVALALAGCGGQDGGEYLGKWGREQVTRDTNPFVGGEDVKIVTDTLTIDRNGDDFMLRTNRTYKVNNDKPTIYPERKEPAIFKNGELQVAGGLGAYVIDKKSGHLVSPERDGDYTRVN